MRVLFKNIKIIKKIWPVVVSPSCAHYLEQLATRYLPIDTTAGVHCLIAGGFSLIVNP